MEKDILQEIPDEDLPLLRDLYKNYVKEAPQVFSLLNTSIRWKKKKPNSNLLTFMGVNGDWLQSGTFILLMQYTCYDVFVFTLEEDCKTLYKVLVETEKIDWSKRILWYAVASRHSPTMLKSIRTLNLTLEHAIDTELWVIDKEEALKFEIKCPDDVYIGKLNKSHAVLVNSHWPHRYENSEEYLGTFIEMNNCYGIFLKSDDSLVCWVMKTHFGQLGMLQTLPEHLRKGYGTLVTKVLSKEIAEEGHNPLGTILVGNAASQKMFARMGFRSIDICTFFITSSSFTYAVDD